MKFYVNFEPSKNIVKTVEKAMRGRGRQKEEYKIVEGWWWVVFVYSRGLQCVCLLILFLYVAIRFKFRIPAETGIYFGQSTYIYRYFQIWTTFFARLYSLLRYFRQESRFDKLYLDKNQIFELTKSCGKRGIRVIM